MNLNRHHYRRYLRAWYEKRIASVLFKFLWLLGAIAPPPPPIPLLKCGCFIFALKCTSGLILEKNMAQNLGCWFIIKKMLIFRLKITNFGTLKMHEIASTLSKKFRGRMPPDPLPQMIIKNHNRATYASGM